VHRAYDPMVWADSVVEVLDLVIGLGRGELFTVLTGELIMDGVRRHRHIVLVAPGLLQRVLVPVGFDVVDGVLRGLVGEVFTVFARQLLVDALLAHMHHVRVGLGLGQSGCVLGGKTGIVLVFGRSCGLFFRRLFGDRLVGLFLGRFLFRRGLRLGRFVGRLLLRLGHGCLVGCLFGFRDDRGVIRLRRRSRVRGDSADDESQDEEDAGDDPGDLLVLVIALKGKAVLVL